MKHYIVTLPYDPAWTVLPWVERNCKSYQYNSIHFNKVEDRSKIDYVFSDEKDAIFFALKWA